MKGNKKMNSRILEILNYYEDTDPELAKMAKAEHAALLAVVKYAVQPVYVHPGTSPTSHPEWECKLCGHRHADKNQIQHYPICPLNHSAFLQ
jgi:rubrerythrin